jgi:Fic family protein
MLSLDRDFEKRLPASHRLTQAVGTLREYRGREEVFRRQTPQVLESLRQTAMIESVESSNRIEGIVAAKGRVKEIVQEMSEPRDRSEAEIAGYRDVLDTIHGSHENIRLTNGTVLQFHREIFAHTDVRGGRWKAEQNAIVRTYPDGSREIRFQPPPAHLTEGLMLSLNEAVRTFAEEHKVDELRGRSTSWGRLRRPTGSSRIGSPIPPPPGGQNAAHRRRHRRRDWRLHGAGDSGQMPHG